MSIESSTGTSEVVLITTFFSTADVEKRRAMVFKTWDDGYVVLFMKDRDTIAAEEFDHLARAENAAEDFVDGQYAPKVR